MMFFKADHIDSMSKEDDKSEKSKSRRYSDKSDRFVLE